MSPPSVWALPSAPALLNRPSPKSQCLQCHQSYDALAEKTKNLEPNPHKSHLGAVNCVECHKADKPSKQPELMCNSCHNFTLKAK